MSQNLQTKQKAKIYLPELQIIWPSDKTISMFRMITDLKEIRNMRIRDHEKRRSGYKKR